jgi:hypothetical protein
MAEFLERSRAPPELSGRRRLAVSSWGCSGPDGPQRADQNTPRSGQINSEHDREAIGDGPPVCAGGCPTVVQPPRYSNCRAIGYTGQTCLNSIHA